MSEHATHPFPEQAVLAYAAESWHAQGEPADRAVGVLAIAGVAGAFSAAPAQALAARVLAAVPEPRFIDANLFTALAAAAAALRVRGDGFASDYVKLLSEQVSDTATDVNSVLLRVALHGAPNEADARGPLHIPTQLLRSGRSEDIVSVVRAVESASAYGTLPLSAIEPLVPLLEGVALAKFRAYDLPIAMRVCRTVRYLTPETSAALAQCEAFIHHIQGEDGGFGDYAMALSTLNRRGLADAGWTIRSAVTLEAMWTLAELARPRAGLMRALFGTHGLLATMEVVQEAAC